MRARSVAGGSEKRKGGDRRASSQDQHRRSRKFAGGNHRRTPSSGGKVAMSKPKHHAHHASAAPRPLLRPESVRRTVMHAPVLVLNASYEPINVCAARRAIVLVLKGVAMT